MEKLIVGVAGLGLFGRRVAKTLASLGADVLAIDKDASVVETLKDRVTHAVCLDVTDEAALVESGLLACDLVVVAIGEDLGSSILVTALLRKHGVTRVIARSHSDIHAQVLKTVGAERCVDPQDEMAVRLAHEVFAPSVHARLQLSTGQEVIEVSAHPSLHGKTVAELAFRQRYRLNIVAIKRRPSSLEPATDGADAWEVIKLPAPTDVLRAGDVLVLIGDGEMVEAFLDL